MNIITKKQKVNMFFGMKLLSAYSWFFFWEIQVFHLPLDS
jgi:hypothetical protein